MFTDISLAEDLNTKFSDFLKSSNVDVSYLYCINTKGWPCKFYYIYQQSKYDQCAFSSNKSQVGINYFVRVLQQGAWPLSQNNLSPLAIPVELEKTVQMVRTIIDNRFVMKYIFVSETAVRFDIIDVLTCILDIIVTLQYFSTKHSTENNSLVESLLGSTIWVVVISSLDIFRKPTSLIWPLSRYLYVNMNHSDQIPNENCFSL